MPILSSLIVGLFAIPNSRGGGGSIPEISGLFLIFTLSISQVD
jgi:hypothetical protein